MPIRERISRRRVVSVAEAAFEKVAECVTAVNAQAEALAMHKRLTDDRLHFADGLKRLTFMGRLRWLLTGDVES